MTTEPSRSRPRMPKGYGLGPPSEETMLAWSWAEERIAASRNYWICSTRIDGRPHAMPVWGIWLEGAVCFSTGRTSTKGRNLSARADVVIHLESGDDAVVLEGVVAELAPSLHRAFADAYEAKYKFRPDPTGAEDVTYALHPRVAQGWLEADFPNTATRWDFR